MRGSRPAIAIFQADWPMQIHTGMLARAAVEAGYSVHIFTYLCEPVFADPVAIAGSPHVQIISCEQPWVIAPRLTRKLTRIYRALVRLTLGRFTVKPLIAGMSQAATRKARATQYCFVVGVEKLGLLWADAFAAHHRRPAVYFSLELYDETHPRAAAAVGFATLRKAEIAAHQKCVATIVQDPVRAEHLRKFNKVDDQIFIHVPISVIKNSRPSTSRHWHERFAIPETDRVLLYLGDIASHRGVVAIAEAAQDMTQTTIVFHGRAERKLARRLTKVGGQHVRVSTTLVAADCLGELVQAADIGLALYETSVPNDRHTAFSSEKIALYLKSGRPFVAYHSETYEELQQRYHCCELIHHIAELPSAIQKIQEDYEAFSRSAEAAFADLYDAEARLAAAINEIAGLAADQADPSGQYMDRGISARVWRH